MPLNRREPRRLPRRAAFPGLLLGAALAMAGTVLLPVSAASAIGPMPNLLVTDSRAVLTGDANGNGRVDAGDTVWRAFQVRNNGTVNTFDVWFYRFTGSYTLWRSLGCAPPSSGWDGTGGDDSPNIAAGASCWFTDPIPYVVTQADLDANVITVTDLKWDAPFIDSDSGNVYTNEAMNITRVVSGIASPAFSVTDPTVTWTDADADGVRDPGDAAIWSVTVTNTGNTTLKLVPDAAVWDDASRNDGDPQTLTPLTLAPGATGMLSATAVLSQGDIDAAGSASTAFPVCGFSPSNPNLRDCIALSPAYTASFARSAVLGITVTSGVLDDSNGNGRPDAGETMTYTYTIENSGNATAADVSVSGAGVGTASAPQNIPGGASRTATSTVTLTAADVAGEEIVVNAIASGIFDAEPIASEPASFTTPVPRPPAQEPVSPSQPTPPARVDTGARSSIGRTP